MLINLDSTDGNKLEHKLQYAHIQSMLIGKEKGFIPVPVLGRAAVVPFINGAAVIVAEELVTFWAVTPPTAILTAYQNLKRPEPNLVIFLAHNSTTNKKVKEAVRTLSPEPTSIDLDCSVRSVAL